MDLEKSQGLALLSDCDLENVSGGDGWKTNQKVTYGIGSCVALVACVGFVVNIVKPVKRCIGAIKKLFL